MQIEKFNSNDRLIFEQAVAEIEDLIKDPMFMMEFIKLGMSDK